MAFSQAPSRLYKQGTPSLAFLYQATLSLCFDRIPLKPGGAVLQAKGGGGGTRATPSALISPVSKSWSGWLLSFSVPTHRLAS